MSEKQLLRLLTLLGILSLPILFRKQPIKDWILVFALKAFYSGFADSLVVAKKRIIYPVRLLPNIFNIHILFDLLLFPIACVLYNQITQHSKIFETIYKVFYISTPILLFEIWAEKKTKLIHYKNWNWVYSFLSLNTSFWLVRLAMSFIRKIDTTN